MPTKKELIEMLEPFDDDDVVICMDEQGIWDNILQVKQDEGSSSIDIVSGGGSPFSSE